jgi:hypothetical protein
MTKRSLMDSLRGFFAGDPDEEPAAGPGPESGPRPAAGALPGDPLGGDWKERIPQSSLKRVLAIRDAVRDLEQETASRGMQTELDELGRIKSTHLPRLIQSYIEIPEQHRADVFRETGRSASFLLNESLDKMLARLRDISSQLARGNITTFAENVRFVDLYYEQSKGPFD